MLNCQRVTELATEHLEGRLAGWIQLGVRAHLALCRHCRRYLRQIETTARALGQLAATPPAPQIERRLVAVFQGRSPQSDWSG